jgi:hypothetical protein
MTQQPEHEARRREVEEWLACAGIKVTEEGRARARAKLDAADARRDPEKREALRRRLGFPPREA